MGKRSKSKKKKKKKNRDGDEGLKRRKSRKSKRDLDDGGSDEDEYEQKKPKVKRKKSKRSKGKKKREDRNDPEDVMLGILSGDDEDGYEIGDVVTMKDGREGDVIHVLGNGMIRVNFPGEGSENVKPKKIRSSRRGTAGHAKSPTRQSSSRKLKSPRTQEGRGPRAGDRLVRTNSTEVPSGKGRSKGKVVVGDRVRNNKGQSGLVTKKDKKRKGMLYVLYDKSGKEKSIESHLLTKDKMSSKRRGQKPIDGGTSPDLFGEDADFGSFGKTPRSAKKCKEEERSKKMQEAKDKSAAIFNDVNANVQHKLEAIDDQVRLLEKEQKKKQKKVDELIRQIRKHGDDIQFCELKKTHILDGFSLEDVHDPLRVACAYVHDAFYGRDTRHLEVEAGSGSYRLSLYSILYHSYFRTTSNLARIGMLALAYFEHLPKDDPMFMAPRIAAFLDLTCIGWFAFEHWMSIMSCKLLWAEFQTKLLAAAIVVASLDSGAGLVIEHNFRVTRLLRVYFYSRGSDTIMEVFMIANEKLYSSTQILVFLVLWVFFATCIAFIMWRPMNYMGYYPNFGDIFYNMFVCLSTANFPDIMLEPLQGNELIGFVFFFVYLIIGFVFLNNMVLANIMDGVTQAYRTRVLTKLNRVDYGLKTAFKLLLKVEDDNADQKDKAFMARAKDEAICKETFEDMIILVRPYVSQEQADTIWSQIDNDNSNSLSLDEFLDNFMKYFGLPVDLDDKIELERKKRLSKKDLAREKSLAENPLDLDAFATETDAGGGIRSRIRNFLFYKMNIPGIGEIKAFEFFMDIIVSIHFMFVVVSIEGQAEQAADQATGGQGGGQDDQADQISQQLGISIDQMFLFLYSGEVVIKVWIVGPGKYFFQTKHLFDLCCTGLGYLAFFTNVSSQIMVIRLARVGRFMSKVDAVQKIGRALMVMGPHYIRLFTALFLILYCFILVSILLFQNKLNRMHLCPETPFGWEGETSNWNPAGPAFMSSLVNETTLTVRGQFPNGTATSQTTDFNEFMEPWRLAGDPCAGNSDYIGGSYNEHMHFNDFTGAARVAFMLIIVNNWHVLVDACTEVTGKWVRWYFIVFYLFINLYFYNIIISFTIAAFDAVDSSNDTEDTKDMDMSIKLIGEVPENLKRYVQVSFDV